LRDDQGKQLPRANTLSVRVIKDVNTVLTAFRHDDLDILNVPLALYGEVFENDGSIRTAWRGYGYREVRLNNLKFLCFNMQAAPWGGRVELRRQVEASLDREAIVRELFRGKARAANSVIPSGMLDSLTASSARVP